MNVKVANVSDTDLTVSVNTVLNACLYTGQKKGFVAQDIAEETISSGEGTSIFFCKKKLKYLVHIFQLDVPFDTYKPKFIDDHMSMKIESVATVRETDKSYCDAIDFQFGNDPSAVSITVIHK